MASDEQMQAATEALAVAHAFWRALAHDDDAALVPICFGGFLHNMGGAGPGIARVLRERLELERDQCASMGLSNRVRLLDDGGLIVVGMQPRGLGLQLVGLNGPEIRRVWSLLVYQTEEDRVRRIFGSVPLEEVRPRIVDDIYIELDIPAEGPIQ